MYCFIDVHIHVCHQSLLKSKCFLFFRVNLPEISTSACSNYSVGEGGGECGCCKSGTKEKSNQT